MRHLSVALFAGLWLGCGQLHARELQVPFDHAGRLEVIDLPLAEQLGLFLDEYPGFRAARLFRLADGSFVLEVTLLDDGQRLRQRTALNAAETAALSTLVTERLSVQVPGEALNQEGRFIFLIRMLPLGLSCYGTGVPILLDIDDASAFTGAYLLSSGGAFFLPYYLTRNRPVSYAQSVLGVYGASRGILHAYLLDRALFDRSDYDSSTNRRRLFAIILPLGAAETVAGMHWAGRTDLSAGSANAIQWMGDAGMAAGALAGGILDLAGRNVSTLALAGGVLGIIGGNALAERRQYTYADTDIMGFTGLLGVLSGMTVMDWFSDDPGRTTVQAAILAGLAGGMVAGDRLVRHRDFSIHESVIIAGGSVAGGLMGTGIFLLAGAGDHALTAATAGALAGFGTTFLALAPDTRPSGRSQESGDLQLGISPIGIAPLGLPPRGLSPLGLLPFGLSSLAQPPLGLLTRGLSPLDLPRPDGKRAGAAGRLATAGGLLLTVRYDF